jgi:hypothetical protein
LTNAQIDEKLFIGITPVIIHRKNIPEKFKVNNTAALIKRAFEGGYINKVSFNLVAPSPQYFYTTLCLSDHAPVMQMYRRKVTVLS